jgi:hypothetical protein
LEVSNDEVDASEDPRSPWSVNAKRSAEATHNRVLQLDLFLLPVRGVLVFLRLFGSPDRVSFFSESIL